MTLPLDYARCPGWSTETRKAVNAWWDETFTTDYIIDRGGNYKPQADCIEDLVIRICSLSAHVENTTPEADNDRPHDRAAPGQRRGERR